MRTKYITVVLFTFFLLTGCSSPINNIYDSMEAAAVKEEEFQKQQQPITELETAEKELFDEIMELGMKEFDSITKLADQALENLNQREEYLNNEKASIEASKEAFQSTTTLFEEIKDEDLLKQAKDLEGLMMERYEAYGQVYDTYMTGLEEDRKIYELIKNKELQLEDLQTQIEASNQAYEKVFEANERFNQLTEQFNEEKMKFYIDSGLNINTNNSTE